MSQAVNGKIYMDTHYELESRTIYTGGFVCNISSAMPIPGGFDREYTARAVTRSRNHEESVEKEVCRRCVGGGRLPAAFSSPTEGFDYHVN